MSVQNVPLVGSEVELPYSDGTPTVHVTCFHSFGAARLMAVRDADGDQGVVAFQPDGSWWWVREIEKREPWQSDGEAWR